MPPLKKCSTLYLACALSLASSTNAASHEPDESHLKYYYCFEVSASIAQIKWGIDVHGIHKDVALIGLSAHNYTDEQDAMVRHHINELYGERWTNSNLMTIMNQVQGECILYYLSQ